ncbi:HNH endonuclease [Shewanella pneumatophori]|uniref:HNH endonuclease n=1 Tax=Shewanella pneumatophori TaxID=314092 RepID=A0A9X1ZQM7_9GAMM|nr:HNH endonuclease [Shewanella pneumatophori]MCL1140226.1 HNH endonuclease [Shewanella pneumatophori]
MRFEDWMCHKGLSESSIKKYSGAVNGVLSDWAIEGGIVAGSLASISCHSQFHSIASSVRKLPIYLERNKTGHGMYNSALSKYSEYLSEGFDSSIENDVDSILADDVTDTEKATLLKVRLGQGKFRQELLTYWGACAVTGYEDPSFLIASHIKPWSASDNCERLDYHNGLLLVANLDKAFDSGFVSFSENGQIMISKQLKEPEKLGIHPTMSVELKKEHQVYMDFHRKRVFRNS